MNSSIYTCPTDAAHDQFYKTYSATVCDIVSRDGEFTQNDETTPTKDTKFEVRCVVCGEPAVQTKCHMVVLIEFYPEMLMSVKDMAQFVSDRLGDVPGEKPVIAKVRRYESVKDMLVDARNGNNCIDPAEAKRYVN
jgi:hypothetical protein